MTKELILQAREKANAGLRLNLQEALALYEDNDLLFLADCARRMKEKKSGRERKEQCMKEPVSPWKKERCSFVQD